MRNSFYCSCLVFLALCSPADKSLTETEKSAVISEVQLMFQRYFDTVRREGLTGEFKYLDNAADFFWVPPGYKAPLSYDSVAAILKLNALNFETIENSFDSLRIIPLSHDLAAYTGTVRSVMKDTAGNVSSIQLIETGVVIRRKDGWKLLNGQTSLVE